MIFIYIMTRSIIMDVIHHSAFLRFGNVTLSLSHTGAAPPKIKCTQCVIQKKKKRRPAALCLTTACVYALVSPFRTRVRQCVHHAPPVTTPREKHASRPQLLSPPTPVYYTCAVYTLCGASYFFFSAEAGPAGIVPFSVGTL